MELNYGISHLEEVFCFLVFCFVDCKVAPYIYIYINFLLSCYKFSINSVLGTYLIWKHLPSTILHFSTMCSHGTCTHVHASNTKNESYRKGLERTSRSHSFLRQSVMGIVNNPHGHPTKSVSSKTPVPMCNSPKIKNLRLVEFLSCSFHASGLGKNVKVS